MAIDHTDDGSLRILVRREGDVYVAQCLEFDIGAEAADIDTLRDRLQMTFRAEFMSRNGTEDDPFPGIDPAPRFYHEAWAGCEFRTMPQPVSGVDHGTTMQLALCA